MRKKKDVPVTNVKSKRKRHPMKTFFSFVVIFIACFLIVSAAQDVMMTIQLKKEISASQQMVDDLENQKTSLSKEKENLENPDYVKRFVRGKYLVSKPGEQVFILPPKSDSSGD